MPDDKRSAKVFPNGPGSWTNRHENVVQKYAQLYDVWNTPDYTNNRLGDLQLTVKAIQGLIADAVKSKTQLRGFGGGWSLSTAAVTGGTMVNTKPMNWYLTIAPTSLDPAYKGNPHQLVFMQCGMSVQEANKGLAKLTPALALKTSGASNGQTMIGAISTGTHGSAFNFGAMQDYVVGMHIITGPDSSVWLERSSHPVVNDGFVQRLGTQLKRDDDLFNAALVSFGSFGIIHAVLIEAEPLYLLNTTRWRVPYARGANDPLRHAMTTLDFSGLDMPRPGTPHHFEVVFNPHDIANGAYVTAMYKQPYTPGYTPPSVSFGGMGPGDDLLAVVGKLTNLLPQGILSEVVNLLASQNYKTYRGLVGMPGEIFNTTTTFGKGMSVELGVPLNRSADALDLVLATQEVKSYAGFIAFRFVKQSSALMAFTKFAPVTCTIEFPAAFSATSQHFYDRVWSVLESNGIPYTLHWGQMNNFTPARVRAMYGTAVDRWISCRNALLAPEVRSVFSNAFVQGCGLG
jgi:FAD/FMN-containing dehydrogenase